MTIHGNRIVISVFVLLIILVSFQPPSGGDGNNRPSDIIGFTSLGDGFGHGNTTESFDDPGNTTLSGSSIITNGLLTLSDISHQADFNDGTYQGWTTQGSDHEIIDGTAKLVKDGALVLDLDIYDFTFTADIMLGQDTEEYREGFYFAFFGTDPWDITVFYRTSTDNITFKKEEKDGVPEWIADVPFFPNVGQWYTVKVEHRGENFKFYVDDVLFLSEDVLGIGWTRAIMVTSLMVGTLYVDNTTLVTGDTAGGAITASFKRPFNRWWDKVELKFDAPGDSSVSYTVFDSYNNRSWWPSLQEVTEPVLNISIVFPYETDMLYLEIILQARDWDFPSVEWVRFSWRPDPPTWSEELPTLLETLEDEPLEEVWDLADYTGDWFVAGYDLVHDVVLPSNVDHVLPVIDGRNLSIELPTHDWYGEETFALSVSDGEFTSLSPTITVVVDPVNDPPTILDPGVINVVEEEERRFDLAPFIFDVDNAKEDLTLRVVSSNCTVEEYELVFYYDVGNVVDDVTVYVSDGLREGNRTLRVIVENLNDPPNVLDIPTQNPTEEGSHEVDLAPFLTDEDNEISDLVLSSDDPNVASIDGAVITLLFEEWVEAYRLVFDVFDGIARTPGGFDVEVTPVNDPPVIVSVGGQAAGSSITITISEGTTMWYEVLVEDPDTTTFGFYVTTDLVDVQALYNGTLEVSPRKGDLGEFIVSVVVDDKDGGTDEVYLTVLVGNVNDPPTNVLLTEPNVGKVVKEGMNVTFDVSFDDPDLVHGQVLTITWSSNVSGVLGTFTSEDFAPFTRNDLSPGKHLITVTVSDGEFEKSASGELTIERAQGPGSEPNGNDGEGDEGLRILWISIVIVLVVVIIGVGYWQWKRKERS